MKPHQRNSGSRSRTLTAALLLAASAARAQPAHFEKPVPPTEAEAQQVLAQSGLANRAVCYLSAVSFPYVVSNLELFTPNPAIGERLAKLGLLAQHQDPGAARVRFELTDAGKKAYSAGNSVSVWPAPS